MIKYLKILLVIMTFPIWFPLAIITTIMESFSGKNAPKERKYKMIDTSQFTDIQIEKGWIL